MKKKTRDLKIQYRYLEKILRDFELDLSNDSWYSLWHTHLDWHGITNNSPKQRRRHILFYLKILDKIEQQTKDCNRDFQTWIHIAAGYDDAIYFHTENPNGDFPLKLDNIEVNPEISKILDGLLDFSKYYVGKIINLDEKDCSYFIQKKELGIRISEN